MNARFISTSLYTRVQVGSKRDVRYLTWPFIAEAQGYRITVQTGFETDGASIPRWAWTLIGHPWGEYLPAAVIHDVLCKTQLLPREVADRAFHDLMTVLGVNSVRLHAMFLTVRAAGWVPWDQADDTSRAFYRPFVEIQAL